MDPGFVGTWCAAPGTRGSSADRSGWGLSVADDMAMVLLLASVRLGALTTSGYRPRIMVILNAVSLSHVGGWDGIGKYHVALP